MYFASYNRIKSKKDIKLNSIHLTAMKAGEGFMGK
jgi:hypothetical protein